MEAVKWILLCLLNIVCGQDRDDSDEYEKFRKFGTLHTMETLMQWSRAEEEIVQILHDRLAHLKKLKEMMKRYTKSYEESSGDALKTLLEPNLDKVQRGNVIGSSIVLAHLMTHRYANTISPMRQLLESDAYRDNQKKISAALRIRKDDEYELETELLESMLVDLDVLQNKSRKVPDWQDVFVSSMAIMHIQEIYGVPPKNFRIGLPINTNYGGELKALHCAKLGIFALQTYFPHYYNAIEWFELGLKLMDKEESDDDILRPVLQSLLNLAIQTHNKAHIGPKRDEEAELWVHTFLEPTMPFDTDRITGRDQYINYFNERFSGNSSNQYTRLLTLCGGETFQTEAEKANLKCYLERKKHPYFILNPVKTEQLSEYPYVIKMYEVLGNETIKNMKSERGYGILSTIATSLDLTYSLSQRTSVGFLPSAADMEFKIDKKTEMLTGLAVSREDESVQVAEYVYGRYYTHHPDAFDPDILNKIPRATGNRLATVLYYLEEPDLGGYTPFCEVGTFSESTAGSALFWINLFKNGSARTDVTHAACPVVHGNKIVINRWIGETENFQTYPCSLNQYD